MSSAKRSKGNRIHLSAPPTRLFFMWLAVGDVIRANWTNEIHDEWMHNVERDYGIARSVLERVRKLMDRAAGDALIRHYRQHEHLFTKTDAKDRHVAAVAVAARKRSKGRHGHDHHLEPRGF